VLGRLSGGTAWAGHDRTPPEGPERGVLGAEVGGETSQGREPSPPRLVMEWMGGTLGESAGEACLS